MCKTIMNSINKCRRCAPNKNGTHALPHKHIYTLTDTGDSLCSYAISWQGHKTILLDKHLSFISVLKTYLSLYLSCALKVWVTYTGTHTNYSRKFADKHLIFISVLKTYLSLYLSCALKVWVTYTGTHTNYSRKFADGIKTAIT